jgi:hypothetical protein
MLASARAGVLVSGKHAGFCMPMHGSSVAAPHMAGWIAGSAGAALPAPLKRSSALPAASTDKSYAAEPGQTAQSTWCCILYWASTWQHGSQALPSREDEVRTVARRPRDTISGRRRGADPGAPATNHDPAISHDDDCWMETNGFYPPGF